MRYVEARKQATPGKWEASRGLVNQDSSGLTVAMTYGDTNEQEAVNAAVIAHEHNTYEGLVKALELSKAECRRCDHLLKDGNVLCRDCPTHDLIGAALKRARNMADMEDE